jgi:uncharacterized membrane protein (UPF0127 family)
VSVEIADDPAEREHGLMKRDTLGADQGCCSSTRTSDREPSG